MSGRAYAAWMKAGMDIRLAVGLSVVVLAGCAPMAPSGDKATSEPVTASIWALRSFQNQDLPRSRREVATLRLMPDHGIAGTASCNSVGGRELTWTASTDRRGTFARDPAQPTIMTLVGCADTAATELAGRFWTMMATARAWSLDGGNLTVRFGDGTTALLKPIGPAPGPSVDCRQADPNNFDCRHADQ